MFFFDVHMFLSVFRFLLHLQLLYGLSGTSLREGQWEIPGGFHEKALLDPLGMRDTHFVVPVACTLARSKSSRHN